MKYKTFFTAVFLPGILFITCSTRNICEPRLITSSDFPAKNTVVQEVEYQTARIENSNSNTLWPVAKFSTEIEKEYKENNRIP